MPLPLISIIDTNLALTLISTKSNLVPLTLNLRDPISDMKTMRVYLQYTEFLCIKYYRLDQSLQSWMGSDEIVVGIDV